MLFHPTTSYLNLNIVICFKHTAYRVSKQHSTCVAAELEVV